MIKSISLSLLLKQTNAYEKKQGWSNSVSNTCYYMANPVFGKSLCSDCSFFTLTLPEEAKKIEISPKFQSWMEKTNIFKSKPPEVHFTIRNREPYNKQLTNLACSSRTVEYWPSVIFVQISLRPVRTVTTSVQYSPVRPSRAVSKRLLFHLIFRKPPPFFIRVWLSETGTLQL